ncbi:S8 family serine peptidase [Natrinema ejinorense]|uniref:Peptidase S8 n=1 Tax=Natrinema ejinorense TaxID=373386 RepID=A0A2A5R0E9_9EURY|nr:S8 family serine peptidase [Natrinema ejinorense]PCR92566.1 peptidase S8 [Natrinema ejinorense]
MAPRRPSPVSLPVFAVVVCLLLASVFAPVVLGLSDGSVLETESADDAIVVDDALPTNGTTVEAVVRLEEATVPEGIGEAAAERRLETHAESTQESLLEHVRETDRLSVEETFWLTNAVLVEVDTGAVDYETFEQFGAVEAVHENFEVSIPEPPRRANTTGSVGSSGSTVGERNTTAGVAQVNAPAVWEEYDTRGEGVRVAVLDTGVDVSHPDIDLATDDPSDPTYPGGWAEFDASGQRVPRSTPHDTGTHGTHVSGTVAGGATSGTAIGVAPEAELLHGLVMSETSGSFAQVVAGMEWALRSDADVINLSLGATGAHPALIDPVRNARHSGAVVVGAVGNEGAGTSDSPGNVYETISVGAVDGVGTVPPFSGGQRLNRTDWNGSPADWDAPSSYVVPDVVAPGVAVTSAGPDGGYATIPGTSMATPHVSGTAALLLSAEPDATPDEIETALTETARVPENRVTERDVTTDDGDGRLDTRYGHGIVDASAAADALVAVRGSMDPTTVRSSDVDTTDDPNSTWPPVFAAGIALVGVTLTLALLARHRFGER